MLIVLTSFCAAAALLAGAAGAAGAAFAGLEDFGGLGARACANAGTAAIAEGSNNQFEVHECVPFLEALKEVYQIGRPKREGCHRPWLQHGLPPARREIGAQTRSSGFENSVSFAPAQTRHWAFPMPSTFAIRQMAFAKFA